jgi:hypothetical protein
MVLTCIRCVSIVNPQVLDSVTGRDVDQLQRLALVSSASLTWLLCCPWMLALAPGGALRGWFAFFMSTLVSDWPLAGLAIGCLVTILLSEGRTERLEGKIRPAAALVVVFSLFVCRRTSSVVVAVPYFLVRTLGLVRLVMVGGPATVLAMVVRGGHNLWRGQAVGRDEVLPGAIAVVLTWLAWLSNSYVARGCSCQSPE